MTTPHTVAPSERPHPWDRDAPHAHVDLDALRHNLALLRARTAPGVRLLAAVKADAYGHGLLPVARALAAAGAEAFGVATAAEALALRGAGVPGDVLAFGPVRAGIAELVAADVALTVAQPADLEAIAAAAAGARARVHVKVDTGMGRLGLAPAEARALIAAVDRSPLADLEGVWTHLASADEPDATEPDSATHRQVAAFAALLARLERDGLRPRWAHAANSAGTLLLPEVHHDLVRPGIALYGQPASAWLARRVPDLRPVMRVDAPVTFVKRVTAGTPISYGGTWCAPRDTVVATVRLGYADGYPRSLSSQAEAGHRGRRVPVVGRVCMDQLMLDLGPDGDAELGERVDLIGGGAPTAFELAADAGSFAYELLTRIGPRVVRRYPGT
ncbi:MAG: alanine racemase [Trueperaceae bacterium]|nr:alanine racemase [Trueperaceae bacterium]